jgi:hypothetical protein
VPGVVRFDTEKMKMVIDARDFLPYAFYAPWLASSSLSDGDCVLFGYNVDLGSKENADRETTKLIYGQITQEPSLVSQYPCDGYMLDTTQLLANEQSIAYAVDANWGVSYVSGKLFVCTDLVRLEDQRTGWVLYYDPDLKAETEDQTKRIYSLFLRATITREGIQPTVSEAVINAFDAQSLFDQIELIEKNYENTSATPYLKFNYVNEIKDSTLVWKYDMIPLY